MQNTLSSDWIVSHFQQSLDPLFHRRMGAEEARDGSPGEGIDDE